MATGHDDSNQQNNVGQHAGSAGNLERILQFDTSRIIALGTEIGRNDAAEEIREKELQIEELMRVQSELELELNGTIAKLADQCLELDRLRMEIQQRTHHVNLSNDCGDDNRSGFVEKERYDELLGVLYIFIGLFVLNMIGLYIGILHGWLRSKIWCHRCKERRPIGEKCALQVLGESDGK